MMPLDVDPDTLARVPVPAFIAQAVADQPAKAIKVDATLDSGQSVEQDGGNNTPYGEHAQGRILAPAGEAIFLLTSSGWLQRNGITSSEPKAFATVEATPKHGRLDALPNGEFRYTPNKGFLGKDFVSFIVNIEGKRIRLNTPPMVVKHIEDPKA